MNNKQTDLYQCYHCNNTGTCSLGDDGCACQSCVKYNELPNYKWIRISRIKYKGLVCGVCRGVIYTDTTTDRMNNRAPVLFALKILIIAFLISSIICILDRSFSQQILTAWLSMASVAVGYFFSKRNDIQNSAKGRNIEMRDKELLDEERKQAAIWEMIARRLAARLADKEGRSVKEIINVEHLNITGTAAFAAPLKEEDC